jgi:hypothetical protein
MSVRASTAVVLDKVDRRLLRDARKVAGENTLISRTEQAGLSDDLLKKAAENLRVRGGRGARVTVDALVGEASSQVRALLGQVNQGSGVGASLVSEREVRAVAALNQDAGRRVARAYELITGKRIVIAPSALPAATPLTAARIAQITDAARTVAGYNDMTQGEIPAGRSYVTLEVLRDTPPGGRRYTVYVPVEPGDDANTVESMWLESVDAEGSKRTARFAVPLDLDVPGELTGAELVGRLQSAINGLSRWHDSGDNGVDTRVLHIAGVQTAQAALDYLLGHVSAGTGGALVTTESDALNAFRARASADLEEWRETFYDGEPVPASDEASAAMTAFDDAVTAQFASLPEVHLARGNDREQYLLGRVSDGYVAVVIWPYRDA